MLEKVIASSIQIGYSVRISYLRINKDKAFRSSFLVSAYKISFDYLKNHWAIY